MKRLPIIAVATATVALGGSLLAVPALADTWPPAGSSSIAATPLTVAEQEAIDSFLADHPVRAHELARRAAAWEAFLTAHPALAAEIDKVKAWPVAERRAEITTYLAAHPGARAALRDYRASLRSERRLDRQDRRQGRQDRRQERRDQRNTRDAPATSFTV